MILSRPQSNPKTVIVCELAGVEVTEKQESRGSSLFSVLVPKRSQVKKQRRAIAQYLTAGIVGQHDDFTALNTNNLSRILVCRPNHRLGNLLALTPLLTELENLLPWAEIDVVAAGNVAHEIYCKYPGISKVFLLPHYAFKSPLKYIRVILAIRKRNYDLVINSRVNSGSGRLIAKLARTRRRILTIAPGGDTQSSDFRHFAKGPVCLLRGYLDNATQMQKIPPLDMRLSKSENQWGNETLSRIFKQQQLVQSKPVFALYTHATGNKCYDEKWWQTFYKQLQEKFEACSFIEILPVHAQSSLGSLIPTFYSSDIRKLGSLISATDIFIAADGGVMHLASAVNVRTIGLFSATSPENFGPYGGDNNSIVTNSLSVEKIVLQVAALIDPVEA